MTLIKFCILTFPSNSCVAVLVATLVALGELCRTRFLGADLDYLFCDLICICDKYSSSFFADAGCLAQG